MSHFAGLTAAAYHISGEGGGGACIVLHASGVSYHSFLLLLTDIAHARSLEGAWKFHSNSTATARLGWHRTTGKVRRSQPAAVHQAEDRPAKCYQHLLGSSGAAPHSTLLASNL